MSKVLLERYQKVIFQVLTSGCYQSFLRLRIKWMAIPTQVEANPANNLIIQPTFLGDKLSVNRVKLFELRTKVLTQLRPVERSGTQRGRCGKTPSGESRGFCTSTNFTFLPQQIRGLTFQLRSRVARILSVAASLVFGLIQLPSDLAHLSGPCVFERHSPASR